MSEREQRLVDVAKWLSEEYLANAGTYANEFVSCITPERGSYHHIMWRELYVLSHAALEDTRE